MTSTLLLLLLPVVLLLFPLLLLLLVSLLRALGLLIVHQRKCLGTPERLALVGCPNVHERPLPSNGEKEQFG